MEDVNSSAKILQGVFSVYVNQAIRLEAMEGHVSMSMSVAIVSHAAYRCALTL